MATPDRIQKSTQARLSIDSRLEELQVASSTFVRPTGGWISTIRSALGMSIGDLATRLQVLPSTVKRLELSEQSGTINFESLQKVADVLDCEFVYALVPRRSIEVQVTERTRKIATSILYRVQETMGLEQQALSPREIELLIQQESDVLRTSSRLWKEKN
jgi:predicted DNA-binding mobile mystery protein A